MKSFVDYSSNSDFSIHNIPFGVAVFNKEYIGCCTRIGDQVIDLATLYDLGYFEDIEGLDDNVLRRIPSTNLSSWGNLLPTLFVLKSKPYYRKDQFYQKIRKLLKKLSMTWIK